MTNFLIGRAYRDYLSAMGFCVEQVLKKAGLPEDLFARQAPCLGAEEYFRFLQAIEALSPDKDAPVRLAFSAWTGASVSKSRQPGVWRLCRSSGRYPQSGFWAVRQSQREVLWIWILRKPACSSSRCSSAAG